MADGIECGLFPDKLNSSGDSFAISYDCKFELEVIDSSNFVYLVNTNANFCRQRIMATQWWTVNGSQQWGYFTDRFQNNPNEWKASGDFSRIYSHNCNFPSLKDVDIIESISSIPECVRKCGERDDCNYVSQANNPTGVMANVIWSLNSNGCNQKMNHCPSAAGIPSGHAVTSQTEFGIKQMTSLGLWRDQNVNFYCRTVTIGVQWSIT